MNVLGRSIPTCVGQPRKCHSAARMSRVYPHVCGATIVSNDPLNIPGGLSPRVWGNHACGNHRTNNMGSIPTCVGQPAVVAAGGLMRKVYPHVCGATSKKCIVILKR